MDKYWRTAALVRAECPFARIELIGLASMEQVRRVHTAEKTPGSLDAERPRCGRLTTSSWSGERARLACRGRRLADASESVI